MVDDRISRDAGDEKTGHGGERDPDAAAHPAWKQASRHRLDDRAEGSAGAPGCGDKAAARRPSPVSGGRQSTRRRGRCFARLRRNAGLQGTHAAQRGPQRRDDRARHETAPATVAAQRHDFANRRRFGSWAGRREDEVGGVDVVRQESHTAPVGDRKTAPDLVAVDQLGARRDPRDQTTDGHLGRLGRTETRGHERRHRDLHVGQQLCVIEEWPEPLAERRVEHAQHQTDAWAGFLGLQSGVHVADVVRGDDRDGIGDRQVSLPERGHVQLRNGHDDDTGQARDQQRVGAAVVGQHHGDLDPVTADQLVGDPIGERCVTTDDEPANLIGAGLPLRPRRRDRWSGLRSRRHGRDRTARIARRTTPRGKCRHSPAASDASHSYGHASTSGNPGRATRPVNDERATRVTGGRTRPTSAGR